MKFIEQSPLEDELNALRVTGDDVTNTPEPGAENEIVIAARTDHKSDTDSGSGSAVSEKSTLFRFLQEFSISQL